MFRQKAAGFRPWRILLLVVSATVCGLVGCKSERHQWMSEILEDGTLVVTSRGQPKHGELTLSYELDLEIRESDQENPRFFRVYPNRVCVDSRGKIYVLDSGSQTVEVFEPDGSHLRTIGRPGEGPGEFMQPWNLSLDGQGRLCVNEFRRAHLFNADGTLLWTHRLQEQTDIVYTLDSCLVAVSCVAYDPDVAQAVVMMDSSGTITREAGGRVSLSRLRTRGESGVSFSYGLDHAYTPRLILTPLDDDHVLWATSSRYEMFVLDESGVARTVIRKNEKPIPISGVEKEAIVQHLKTGNVPEFFRHQIDEAVIFPPHRPYFNGIIVDDRGRIFVWRMPNILDQDGEDGVEIDIFSRAGEHLYRAQAPHFPTVIKNGLAYNRATVSDDGSIAIQRWRIANWDSIRDR